MNGKNLATVVVILAALAGISVIAGIVLYAIQNDSGHTGFNPYLALVVFVPVTFVGILHLVLLRNTNAPRWCAIIAVVVGIAGTGLLVYLDPSNTLLQYEVWIQRGMP